MGQLVTKRQKRYSSDYKHRSYGIWNYLHNHLRVTNDDDKTMLVDGFCNEKEFKCTSIGKNLVVKKTAFINSRFQQFVSYCIKNTAKTLQP